MHDYDDFDELDGSGLDAPGSDAFSMDAFDAAFSGDTGPGAPPRLPGVDRGVSALVSGETGLRFESLALFAEPLFTHFGLDVADAFALRERPDEAEPEVVSLLEAARLLWAFFELPAQDRPGRLTSLATHLLGAEPTDDDWAEVEAVLAAVEPYWSAMTPEERAAARQPDAPWLDWDALEAHPAFRLAGGGGDHGFGPAELSEMEARALFAQPLVDEAAAQGDFDALDAALERATRYWTVAQAGPHAQQALDEAVAEFAATPADRPAVAEEARRMLARYRDLFPEHAS